LSEGDLFVVSGPSGAGKSTLVRGLLATVAGLDFSVSYTTRPPRPNERAGVDYHFVDHAEFDRMERAGEFMEWARVHDHRYGTSSRLVRQSREAGHDVLLDLDTQGARSVRSLHAGAVLVFVLPPGRRELVDRLRGRRLETSEEVDRRLRKALGEIEQADCYDYLVVNDDIDRALSTLQAIVAARRARAARQLETWRRIVASFGQAGLHDDKEGA
jgi:guanylate kinase